ncbi:MAG: hypothetical protein ABW321_26885 [Polyangiales bacterium]
MRRLQHAALTWLALGVMLGCEPTPDTVTLRIPRLGDAPLPTREIRYEPAGNVVSARLGAPGTLAIQRRDASQPLVVHVPGLCPLTIAAGPVPQSVSFQPVIDLGPDRPPLGFDARFSINVRHGCPERGLGGISWRQLEGLPLVDLTVTQDGFRLDARMPSFAAAHREPVPAGVVPMSPRTQGRVVLEASWQGPDLPPQARRITLVATSRATGLSSVAVSQQLLLSGAGWSVHKAPQGGHARTHDSGVLSVFTPDAPGRWSLADHSGHVLTLQAFWHDKTPYDCGRSECHRAIADYTVASPMSTALERQLNAVHPAAVGCMLDCHVLGEQGHDDGGFLDHATELGWTWHEATRWEDLPQSLRRLGGVRCTACHGPGALPEPDARAQILRSDVCATCHDAPPRYVHVAQWQSSRMARADSSETTRRAPCARCHTTAGFLTHIAARGPQLSREEPPPAGIACAACHAPHASHRGARLLRNVAAPSGITDELSPSSALCSSCHVPGDHEPQPSASSAALWLGRVEVPSSEDTSFQPLTAAGPHRTIANGCIGCHGKSTMEPGSGPVDHSFRVDPTSCSGCHGQTDAAERQEAMQRGLRDRAASLWQRLSPDCPLGLHSDPAADSCNTQRLTRARYEIALVLQDRAAAVHNAVLARALLDDAEHQLSAGPP